MTAVAIACDLPNRLTSRRTGQDERVGGPAVPPIIAYGRGL